MFVESTKNKRNILGEQRIKIKLSYRGRGICTIIIVTKIFLSIILDKRLLVHEGGVWTIKALKGVASQTKIL